jgi:hypothetical protein
MTVRPWRVDGARHLAHMPQEELDQRAEQAPVLTAEDPDKALSKSSGARPPQQQ